MIRHVTLAFVVAFAGAQFAAAQSTLVFDNFSNIENGVTGASPQSTSSTPNTFMGDGYNLLTGTQNITGFDVYPINTTGTTFTGLKTNIYVWGAVNTGTVNAGSPAFSNLLATYSFTSLGTFSSGAYYKLQGAPSGVTPGLTLATPLAIPTTAIGLTLNFQGTTDGTTYNSLNNLSSVIATGTAPTVGSDIFNGYYRNANSETNGNFTTTVRSLGLQNQSLAVRVYGTVAASAPEPTAMAILLVGAGPLGLLVRRRRA
jgi:hypothetical protein